MRRLKRIAAGAIAAVILLIGGALLCAAEWVREESQQDGVIRFAAVDLFIDSDETPLAAWQVELHATRGSVRIVGIENGEHPAFSDSPPYYDPDAMMQDRVILAQYSLARSDHLPSGRTRIATVHVQFDGDQPTDFALTVEAACDERGRRVEVETHYEMRTQP
jgi:hypothetical protein